ncbi:MAG TPA: N-acetylmuramoyl-L-alanine amidase [Rhizobacter sp.]
MNAPTIISRTDWGAAPFRGSPEPLGTVKNIVVHHAAGFAAADVVTGKKRVRDVQRLHQERRGWRDIGYHFLIDAAGNVYQGRPFFRGKALRDLPQFAIGAHVLNMNPRKLGICLLGCFHPPAGGCNDQPSELALASLEALARFVCVNYRADPREIKTHRDFLSTDCPGDLLFEAVAAMRARLSTDLHPA